MKFVNDFYVFIEVKEWDCTTIIYWSNALTERFFTFLIKFKPRKIQVSRFEFFFKFIYPLLLSQKYGVGDKNHSTVTGFFKRCKTWFYGMFLIKIFSICM